MNSFKPGELRYESVSAQTDISLQNGAVVMRPRNQPGSTMLAEPRWFYDCIQYAEHMVINLINITSDTIMAKEGIGTVRMKLVGDHITIIPPGVNHVEIDYTPDSGLNGLDYSVAWDNFMMKTFSNQPGLIFTPDRTDVPGNPLTYPLTYTFRPNGANPLTVVIKRYEVKIEAI